MWEELPAEVLASIGAVAGKKALKDAKGELSPGEHNVDFTVRISGYVKKGPQKTRPSDNGVVDFAALFAAAAEGMTGEQIADVISLASDEKFLDSFVEQGGKRALHKEVCSVMGVPATIEKSVSGSVSCVGLELEEWADGIDLGEAVNLLNELQEQAPFKPSLLAEGGER